MLDVDQLKSVALDWDARWFVTRAWCIVYVWLKRHKSNQVVAYTSGLNRRKKNINTHKNWQMCASQTQSVDLTTQNVNKKHSKEEEKKYPVIYSAYEIPLLPLT